MRKRLLAIVSIFSLTTLVQAQSETKFNYSFNDAPLKKHAVLGAEWQSLNDESIKKPASEKSMKRQIELLESIIALEPEWIDGYWMLGNATFQLGNSMTDAKDRKEARNLFVKGQKATEKCLEKSAKNPICKLYLGTSLGKIASIDGIFSSLKQAETIENLWLDVTKSGINHALTPNTSLQGNVSYALGVFYRLVPDVSMIKWFFGTKGDIQKSIAFHEASVKIDGPNPCNLMMLGISTLCSVKGDVKGKVGQAGLKYLADAKALPVNSSMAETCIADIPKIEKDSSLACGYETSRQQESSEEGLKKLKEEEKK